MSSRRRHLHPRRHPRSRDDEDGDSPLFFHHAKGTQRRSSLLPFTSSKRSCFTIILVLIGAAGLYYSPKLGGSGSSYRQTVEDLSSIPKQLSSLSTAATSSSVRTNTNDSEPPQDSTQLRHRLDSDASSSPSTPDTTKDSNQNGSIAPVLLKDAWKRPTTWQQQELMNRVGEYPQYLKDLTVQPYRNRKQTDELCVVSGNEVSKLLGNHDALFFTNNQENEAFMSELRKDYTIPHMVQHIDGFEVFSSLGNNHSHSFHAHGESWLGQVEGRRLWWFVPPTEPAPKRVNACLYLTGKESLPPKATTSFVQNPGDIVWFPKDWYHATCALDDWTVGIGWQQGITIRQAFPKLGPDSKRSPVEECLDVTSPAPKTTSAVAKKQAEPESEHKEWKWFDGDLNAYYNSLTTDENHKLNPNKVSSYAVHRWLTSPGNTEEHYKLLYGAMERHLSADSVKTKPLKVLDGGCGLGAALVWMEQKAPHWDLTGYTISEEQHKFITETLPKHQFQAKLQTFNDLKGEDKFDVIYSIEALIHSEDMAVTLQEWSQHLAPGGVILLIDDFLAPSVDKTGADIVDFSKSWLANSLVSIEELASMTQPMGLELVEDKDLVEAYKIVEVNYKNKKPAVQPFGGRVHQGWRGSKWRQRLTVEGKLKYDLIALKKEGNMQESNSTPSAQCTEVPIRRSDQEERVPEITSQLMSGFGSNGGKPISCISGWYCCDKGLDWYEKMTNKRTERDVDYLSLDMSLFGHYMDVFARRLNEHYSTYTVDSGGRFLDIGGTGSTAVGMKQVTSKFQNFVGPLEYWKLDSDPAAQKLARTLYCDIDSCPEAESCSFDVTFSHTVLEHAKRPWLAFDTISRITKKGGLTMHLVPWSYQYHATPADNFRFSHTALETLLQDRGFEVLEVGYDICTKQENKMASIDEHYDVIWLTYVVGRKL